MCCNQLGLRCSWPVPEMIIQHAVLAFPGQRPCVLLFFHAAALQGRTERSRLEPAREVQKVRIDKVDVPSWICSCSGMGSGQTHTIAFGTIGRGHNVLPTGPVNTNRDLHGSKKHSEQSKRDADISDGAASNSKTCQVNRYAVSPDMSCVGGEIPNCWVAPAAVSISCKTYVRPPGSVQSF